MRNEMKGEGWVETPDWSKGMLIDEESDESPEVIAVDCEMVCNSVLFIKDKRLIPLR